jgi:hypothetical protein
MEPGSITNIKRKVSKKNKLFKDKWKGKTDWGQILAKMSNILKDSCTGDYCLNIRANEILHESSQEELKTLPVLYPKAQIFSLPFYNMRSINMLGMLWMRQSHQTAPSA